MYGNHRINEGWKAYFLLPEGDGAIAHVVFFRLKCLIAIFLLIFGLIAFRLVSVSLFADASFQEGKDSIYRGAVVSRRNIVDRNGVLIAANLGTASLYVNPKKILDAKESAKKLASALPSLSEKHLHEQFQRKERQFIWVKRHLTPEQHQRVNDLGIPGIYFIREEKRVYPQGDLMPHLLGFVGVDGKGLAGVERYFDEALRRKEALATGQDTLQLSIDIRLQDILKKEVEDAAEEFNVKGAAGIVMDVRNGEVLGMTSYPAFDPHYPGKASPQELFNRATFGSYEVGSSFKAFTLAQALDKKIIHIQDAYDVDSPISASRFRISDFHAKGGWLTVPEIFMYSSNIGTAKIGLEIGASMQQGFLKHLGLLSPLSIELTERSKPRFPSKKRWGKVSTMTISYGHGIAVSPMHVAKAMGAMVNGGTLYPMTLLKQDKKPEGERVITKRTSELMRKLLYHVVRYGTGGRAAVPGYLVGGKTGTANKPRKGGYHKHAKLSSFAGVFPVTNPRYVLFVIFDEPDAAQATGGAVAAPVVANIITRMVPLIGMKPVDEDSNAVQSLLKLNYKPLGENL